MAIPHIQSAIPKKRYQYGEFTITLLTDIQSNDPPDYKYLMAAVREGNAQPEVYITCEKIIHDTTTTYQVRVLSDQQEHTISTDNEWGNENAFCKFALDGISQMFELSDEQPTPIG